MHWEYLTLTAWFVYDGWDKPNTRWHWGVEPHVWTDLYGERLTEALELHKYKSTKDSALNPAYFVHNVLGPDGWELVSVQDVERLQFVGTYHNAGTTVPHTIPMGFQNIYRMWFKRPGSPRLVVTDRAAD